MLELGIIFIIGGMIILFASWRGVRVALLRRKKQLSAHEAKLIAETFESKMKNVLNGIYDDIRTSAFCGNRYVRVLIDKNIDVSHETISLRLKRKGYSVSCYFDQDNDSYVYDIHW